MKSCVLILDNIRSVENTGSIFRTAEGLGVKKIILVGTTPAPIHRFGRKRQDFAKVSLGAEEMIEWEYIPAENFQFTISNLQKNKFEVLSLEQSDKSVALNDFTPEENFALIVGNEVDGVSEAALKLSDKIIEIPMRGKKESLNVSVATGIALFNLLR